MSPAEYATKRGILRSVGAPIATSLLLTLAMPGRLGWWPFLFIALVPLLACIVRCTPGRSALAGLLSGFFYHILLLYWIVFVLGHYGGLQLWFSIPALLLLALYMSVYMAAFAFLLAYISQSHTNTSGTSYRVILVAPVLWVALDWLRGVLFTGFPWMDLGYGLFSQPILIQAADLGGHHLITFCLVMINTVILCLFMNTKDKDQGVLKGGKGYAAIAVLFLFIIGSYSAFRYQVVEKNAALADKVVVGAVQGNIPQDEKWTPENKFSTLDVYRKLTAKDVPENKFDLVVWPETALPFYPGNDPLYDEVTGLASELQIYLLTGSPYFTLPVGATGDRKAIRYYNSALLIGPDGSMIERYDKQHLVPYGEYVPMRRFFPFLEPLVVNAGNLTPGVPRAQLKAGKIKAGMLICYESIFPELARQQVVAGANLLVNITNDAWYGRSSAPRQSFAMTVFRSLENRRTLVRAANTGVSGFVDPLGRVISQSPLFETLILREEVPLLQERTIYMRYGFMFGPTCCIMMIVLVLHRMLGSKRNKA